MGETPEQKFDRISRAVQDSILRNYPNPERKGCSGDEVVREVASRTELNADEDWEHITHCSPCYSTFLDSKKEFRHKRTIRRRTAVGMLAAAAAAIPVVLITRFHAPSSNREIGDWSLEATSSSRGAGPGAEGLSTSQLASRASGYIHVHLPLGSEPGEYQLQIRRTEDGPALRLSNGKAEVINGHTIVRFPVDLAGLAAGAYFAAIARNSRVWRVYPLTLS